MNSAPAIKFRDLLAVEFQCIGALSGKQLDVLERHYALLQIWNARMNLTAVTDMRRVVRFHYCESLFMGKILPPGELCIVDVGSGAGFPGLPIAVCRPECRVTLFESNRRKAVFLREASHQIRNIEIIGERAGAGAQRRFDWMVSRAVTPKEALSLNLAPQAALLLSAHQLERRPPDRLVAVPWSAEHVIGVYGSSLCST